ncbi:MAG: ribosome rescue GTPase HflX [Algiphilus sp.]|uniref:ribosome rescue GTPase HflX n=1 Tax=Algiphilus sp. TaxID=1872431 RepID=UPI0032F008C5
MIEHQQVAVGQATILVHVTFPGTDTEADTAEFVELARSAGADVKRCVGARRQRPDARYFVGRGKADEIAELARADGVELVVFNHDLSPSQERNLEQQLCCRVLGRAGLILDIFAARARTHEGKLQVELAQLQHLATRLVRGWSHLERQKGGIGLRGPGESQLETDRRLLRHRMGTLRQRLEVVRKRRARSRASRQRNETPTVSLVGYTNAGKSTLFNALTTGNTFASDQLFATLDPTLRRFALQPGEHVVLADTVGFIRDLPPDLVAAFRATLEETREADLLLHVVDWSDPERDQRIEQVESVLREIGTEAVPRLLVCNKCDRLEGGYPARTTADLDSEGQPRRVYVSAVSGFGLDDLRATVRAFFHGGLEAVELRLRPEEARLRAQLYDVQAVTGERTGEDGTVHLQLRIPRDQLHRLCQQSGVPIERATSESVHRTGC